jgi:acyl-CoA dehydrogenase
MIDFDLDPVLDNIKSMVNWFAVNEVRPRAIEADRKGGVSDEFIQKVVQLGLSAGGVPKEFGGEGDGIGERKDKAGNRTAGRLSVIGAEEMAFGDPGVILTFPGPGLGGPPVAITGTPEQKKRFFGIFKDPANPRWGAYATTEPGCGSDVAAIATTCRKDGEHYVLNGRKCFITNGARASWVVVFATIDPSLGRAGQRAFVVEKGTPGFSVGKIEKKLGLRASETVELVLEDCRVPKENLLGGEEHYEKAGAEGFKTAMKTFDSSRPMVGAMAVGIARAAFEELRAFVRENYLIGRPIARYGAIREALLEMERKIEAARLLCWNAAFMADAGKPNSKEASMAKAYGAQVGQWVTSKAVEIMGGFGSERERFVEKLYRDIKVYDIFEGTGEVQRLVISRRLMPEIKID